MTRQGGFIQQTCEQCGRSYKEQRPSCFNPKRKIKNIAACSIACFERLRHKAKKEAAQ